MKTNKNKRFLVSQRQKSFRKLVMVLVFFLFWVSFVNAIDIDSCGVLNQEGETYVLQNDIETDDTCFTITADDVTLDCNDHSITGLDNRRENYGVYAGGEGIIITNCDISGFQEGISLGFESQAINNNLHGNALGINVTDRNTIMGNIITRNRGGVVIEGELNIIIGNTITENSEGIRLGWGSESNTITSNIITENFEGIRSDNSDYNIITDNHFENSDRGIILTSADSNTITNNIIGGNGDGIYLDNSDYNIITDNHFEHNEGEGIYLRSAYLNIITYNHFESSSEGGGIYLTNADSNTITNNIINGNGNGIYLGGDANSNTITNNIINENGYGIYLGWDSGSNTITDNTANNNGIYGIYLYNTDSNNIISNTFCYNDEIDIRMRSCEGNEFLYNQCDNIEGDDNIDCMPCDIEEHEIQLNQGWNLISSYLIPYFTDIEAIFGKLARQEKLIMVKDRQGRFYRPENDFNNIPRWISTEAYYVKVNENTELIIKGEEPTPLEIQLERGWNFIAYPLTEALDMEYVIENILAPLIEENILDIVKNGRGNFFVPRWDFNNIPRMRPSEGYMVKVTEDSVIDFGGLNLGNLI